MSGESRVPSTERAPSPFAGSPEECTLGRKCYDAFAGAMAEWAPSAPEWSKLSIRVQRGWIAAAKAARAA